MKQAPKHLRRAAFAGIALLAGSQAKAGLLGYWNFDGPPSATASDRLKDLSGNNYHGNDRNAATPATRVLFNNYDVPRAPFLVPPGNTNYCLDLSGGNRFVVMEGATGIAAAGAVTTAGNAFNIGNSSAASVPGSAGKLTVSFWWKGVSPNAWGDAICKGGETYGTRGFQGWSVRRNNTNNYFAFTARGLIGDSPAGMDYMARSGGTLAAPTVYDPATRTSAAPAGAALYTDNIANGTWQHCTCVWDGRWLHHYVNGFQVRSTEVASTTNYIGTNSLLSFGQNMIADTNAVFGTVRYGQYRMDEIAIFDEALTPGQIEDLARGADPRKPLRSSIRPFDFGWPAASPGATFTTGVATAMSYSPVAEQVFNLIDGLPPLPATTPYTKWLSYAGRTSGFIVTPAASSTVQSFTMITGNDTENRDPASYELYGTNDPVSSLNHSDGRAETWTLISSGPLSLPTGRTTAVPPVGFANSTAYTSYKMVFPSIKSSTAETLFQLTEIQFFPNMDGTGGAILAPTNAIKAIAANTMPPVSAGAPASGYTGGPILPQGGAGTLGTFEMRANGNLKRADGIAGGTNATVYANESPILYARWGCLNNPTGTFGVAPYPFGRISGNHIDWADDTSSATGGGHNGTYTEFLTSSVGSANDQYFQMTQGCFQVPAAGRYTFTMRGDDGAQLAIAGARWVAMYATNGTASYTGELLQNGFPTGDTANIAVVEFPAAGCYNFRYLYNEQGGGAFAEVLYAQGELSAYNPTDFKQIGDPSGGLTLVEHTPIVELRSSTPVVQAGSPATITLSWDSAYSTTTTLNGGVFSNQDVTAQTINGVGTVTIPAPAATTTYTLTGTRPGSPHPTQSRSVTVYVDEPPTILSFTADDSTLVAGAPLTVRWTGLTGTTWSLSDGVNPAVDVTANTTGNPLVLQTGAITFPAPSADTTYTLTATNSNGTSTPATLFIDIGTPPVLTFTSDKASMLQGSYATLNWTVTDGLTADITPRLNNSSLSTSVGFTGTSVESPQLTTTYVLAASNIYGSSTASVTVTLPERIGISPAGWTVQVDYWNRFGYNDPVYGNRTAHNSGVYQSEEMFVIPDADLGERGPLATANISASIPTMTGPAVPPTAQPGNTNKVLMRYRQTGVTVINYDDALTSGGISRVARFARRHRPHPSAVPPSRLISILSRRQRRWS